MSKEGNFTRYVCDRPKAAHADGKERREYVKVGDVKENNWHIVERTDVNGVTTRYCLCAECHKEYIDLAARHDAEFAAFFMGGN